MSEILTLPVMREMLKDRRPGRVAFATGLRPAMVMDIREGRADNPTYKTLKALSDYLTRPESDAGNV